MSISAGYTSHPHRLVTVTVKITSLPIYVAAPFRVKLKSQTFTTYGLIVRKDINFSVKEFDVLYMLYSNPGMAFTKQQIYEAVWHEKANGYFHAVENTIFQIRKKIKKYSSDKNYIKTVVGYGYKFEV